MNNYTESIDKLCEKFGTTIEYLVPKAQACGIWMNAITIIISIIIIAIYAIFLIKTSKKYEEGLLEANGFELTVTTTGFIISGIAFIAATQSFPDLIKWITIPEVALVEMVTNML